MADQDVPGETPIYDEDRETGSDEPIEAGSAGMPSAVRAKTNFGAMTNKNLGTINNYLQNAPSDEPKELLGESSPLLAWMR